MHFLGILRDMRRLLPPATPRQENTIVLPVENGLLPRVEWSSLGIPPGARWDCPDFRVNENGTVPLDARTDSVDTKIRTGPVF